MSTEPRMVTVTIHETRDVDIPEPDWCVDPHDGAHDFTDLTHNGSEVSARVNIRRRTVDFLTAWISHAPYLEGGSEPQPVVAVEVGGDTLSLDPDGVPAFTNLIRAHLDVIEQLAAECARIRGGGR